MNKKAHVNMRPSTQSAGNGALQPANGNVNKPFKSPVIRNSGSGSSMQKSKPPTISLIDDDDIEDSEDDVADKSGLRVDAGTGRSEPESQTVSDTESQLPTKSLKETTGPEEIEKDDNDQNTAPRPLVKRNTSKQKGRYKSKADKQKQGYQDAKRLEREKTEAEEKKRKEEKNSTFTYKRWAKADEVMEKPKQEPLTSETEPAISKPKVQAPNLSEKYKQILNNNQIKLNPDIMALLDDKLKDTDSDLDSDSDDSTSTKKRKRVSGGSCQDPLVIDSKRTRPEKGKFKCPKCKATVSEQLYESYMPDLLKKSQLQKKLHRSHQLEEAYEKKGKLGIPEIDWDQLGKRCAKYFPVLLEIMEGKTQSYYRQQFENFLKKKHGAGVTRTKAMFDGGNWEQTYPGYYGPRGLNIISDAISRDKAIKQVFDKLKTANHITVVKSSVGVCITSILVPELAIRLIMEDLGIPEGKISEGRKMMVDTIELGKVLNNDDDDEVDGSTQDNGQRLIDDEYKDGMDYWWEEQAEKRRLEEEEEEEEDREKFETSVYIED